MLLIQKKIFSLPKMVGSCVICLLIIVSPVSFCQNIKASPQMVNRIVATVNDGIITQVELNTAVNQFITQLKLQQLPIPDHQALAQKTLKQLIIRNVALQMAKRLNISVTDAALDQAIKGIAANNHLSVTQFKKLLKAQHINFENYRRDIKMHMVVGKLQQKTLFQSLFVTPKEIDAFLAQHKKAPTNKRYDVSQILLSLPDKPTTDDIAKLKQKALYILGKIKNGLAFSKAAVQYSASEDAKYGGDLGWKNLNDLPTYYVSPVLGLAPGEIAGPIQTDSGFTLIKLNKVKTIPAPKHIITQYHVRKIVIDVTPVLSNSKAEQIINNISRSAHHGEDFAELATVNSKETKTAKLGGDLGWVSLDMVDPTLGHVIQNTPVNQISQPFKIGSNWVLIKVIGKRQHDDTANFARREAQQAIFKEKATKADLTWQSQILSMATVNILVPSLKTDANPQE